MPTTEEDLTSFFDLFEKHLKKGRNITIYLHYGIEGLKRFKIQVTLI